MDLRKAFPEKFSFYHLGVIEQAREQVSAFSFTHDQELLAYQLQGEWNGVLIVAFANDLDVSTYGEVGNIIASQIATNLYRSQGLDVMIRPPQRLNHAHLSWIIQHSQAPVVARYEHKLAEKAIRVDSLLLQSYVSEENGNA